MIKTISGNTNLISVINTVTVELSKYLIIFLFLFYTLNCFNVFFKKGIEKKEIVYKRQMVYIYVIHFFASLVLYLATSNPVVIFLYAVQVVFITFVNKAYCFVYEGLSRLLLNNMIMLFTIGFLMLERLKITYAIRQMVIAAAICILSLFIPFLIEKFKYFNRFGLIYAVAGIGLLALVFVIGKEIYGARNWIVIGGFQMQPSEFVKIIYVFFLAAFLGKNTTIKNVMIVSILAGVHVLVLVAQKDLGSALLFFITYLVLLYVSSENMLYLIGGNVMGVIAAMASYKLFSHVRVRVAAWQDPWSTIANQGYQVTQSLFAIGTGSWFGMGFTQGLPSKIPVVESDFIFSAIAEEFGTFFAICLILIEISCFVMLINISLRMKRRFYKLTALGLGVEYVFQVILTIGGAIKFIPSTGVTLPLVSYGGSSVISTVILFCIIQGMYVLDNDDRNSEEMYED